MGNVVRARCKMKLLSSIRIGRNERERDGAKSKYDRMEIRTCDTRRMLERRAAVTSMRGAPLSTSPC